MTTMWLATTLGAALFFAAGFLARMIAQSNELRATAPTSVAPGPPLLTVVEAEPAKDERAAAHDELRAERDQLRTERDQLRTERDQLRTERDRMRADREQLRTERDRLRAANRDLVTERDKLRSENKRALDERDRLTAESKRAASAADQSSTTCARLERDLAEARTAGRELKTKLERIEAEHTSLIAEAERMRGQLAAHPELVAESDKLRAQAADRDRLATEVKRLQAEIARLQALELCSAEPPTIAEAKKPPRIASTATALEAILQRVAINANTRAAVIADELGLPVVAIGEHASSLAALGSVVGDAGERARALLPMGPIRGFSMADENSATITSCPITTADAKLMLLTLTVGPGPADETLRTAAREAASAVG